MKSAKQARTRTWSSTWLALGMALCGCSSTTITKASHDGGATSCDSLAGTWDVTVCGTHGQCTFAQQTCSLSVVCSAFLVGQGTATGTIDAHDFSFSADSGVCTGTISGSAMGGTCTDADGGGTPCTVTGTRTP